MLGSRTLCSIALLSGLLVCPTLSTQGQQTLGGLSAQRMHVIIELQPAELRLTEIYVLARAGLQGGDDHLLHFTLPPSATDLRFSEGEPKARYRQVEGGFVDMVPFAPEELSRQVLFSYDLPYQGPTLVLTRTVPYPVASLNVLLPLGPAHLSGPGLTFAGQRTAPDTLFENFVASDLAPEEPIVLMLSNLPANGAKSVPKSGGNMLKIAMALLTIGAGVGVTAPLWYGRGTGGRGPHD